MLNERTWKQKSTHCMGLLFYDIQEQGKSMMIKMRIVAAQWEMG